jgi:hypothetical protein
MLLFSILELAGAAITYRSSIPFTNQAVSVNIGFSAVELSIGLTFPTPFNSIPHTLAYPVSLNLATTGIKRLELSVDFKSESGASVRLNREGCECVPVEIVGLAAF